MPIALRQVRERRPFVALLPEDLQRAVQSLVGVEGPRASQAIIAPLSYRMVQKRA